MASRDLPHSMNEALTFWYQRIPGELHYGKKVVDDGEPNEDGSPKSVSVKNLWPAFISGSGLFSDGYVNNSIGTVTTCLSALYGERYTNSSAISVISAIAFAGTVVGQLGFGYISDNVARKGGMLTANVLLILFTVLCAVATWGKTPEGMFAALATFRFFLGIAIGAEYPTASVIASEFANQLPPGHRNRYFIWFTNFSIDFGFVVSAFVPMVLLWIFTPRHLTPIWRLTLALGVFPPLALFFMRRKMKNSDAFERMSMNKVKKFPFRLVVKFYWFRLAVVSIIWFIYDFSAYSFGLYSSYILTQIIPGDDMYRSWGWNVVFNLFYIPGSFVGGYVADVIGPRMTLFVGLVCQSVIGFGMTAGYLHLKNHIGAFVVVYGIFITMGEFGAGNNVGCLASKTSSTSIRGQYYGIAAAVGKIGAFVGTYIFPVILRKQGGADSDRGIKAAFYISSALCLFSAFLTLFFCPSVGQDSINKEDRDFLEYLQANGYDVSQLGVHHGQDYDASSEEAVEKSNVNVEQTKLN